VYLRIEFPSEVHREIVVRARHVNDLEYYPGGRFSVGIESVKRETAERLKKILEIRGVSRQSAYVGFLAHGPLVTFVPDWCIGSGRNDRWTSRTPASKSATATGAANMMLLLIPFLLAFVLESHSLLDIRIFRANYQLLACFMHDYENSMISND
jgi:hypothetical protein